VLNTFGLRGGLPRKDDKGEKQPCQISLPAAVKKWGEELAEQLGVQVLQTIGTELMSETLKFDDCLARRDTLIKDVSRLS
jgi:hypothetical protein